MSAQTETWIDKSEWGDGTWQNEPDRIEWRTDDAPGLALLMLRQSSAGQWCGYVGVQPGHPWHGKGYSCSCETDQYHYDEGGTCDTAIYPDVHGGLTFAAGCMKDDRPRRERVCHVPQPDESDDVWWLGFDCHHAWDIAPGSVARDRQLAERLRSEGDMEGYRLFMRGPAPDEVYRDARYVQREVESLAEQARNA